MQASSRSVHRFSHVLLNILLKMSLEQWCCAYRQGEFMCSTLYRSKIWFNNYPRHKVTFVPIHTTHENINVP